ncbi:MAG: hypothetical protein FJX47_18335 [Alphaproteobacteria bacterium]|nr:hypothetical protein [Alphaproteobacteria bacterium]
MTEPRSRLWDADHQDGYVRERDAALLRQAEAREGTGIARDFDAAWGGLTAVEREAMTYLALSGARSCVGNCRDLLLAGLVDKGFLLWPPGVRPILTEDLVTTFLIPPAVSQALEQRRGAIAGGRPAERVLAEGGAAFAGRVTPLTTSGQSGP